MSPVLYRCVGAAVIVFATAAPALAQSQAQQGDAVLVILLIVGIILLYVLPSFVAFYRRHPNRWVIAVINVVFGATLLGWLGSLVWALSAVHRSETGNHGGESGLNIFANDVRAVRLVDAPQAAPALSQEHTSRSQPEQHTDDADQLKRLKQLFEQGLLDQDEYARLKGQILDRMMAR